MDNPNVSELSTSSKRLLLSAHFEFLLFKRLRRGLPVEEGELLALLPFTVPNGWRPDKASHESDTTAVISGSDADWSRRVAEAATR